MKPPGRVVAAVALLALGGAGIGGRAGAQSLGEEGFVATAAASGSRITYTVPNFAAVETILDAGGPVAQAVLDSTGTSRSFASLPYPGETVISLPGLISAGSGESFPVSYPAYAGAEDPAVPESSVTDPAGAYLLSARAGAEGSEAQARSGTPEDGEPRSAADSRAAVDQLDGGAVRTRARSMAEGLVFGDGTLRIGRVVSEATAELAPGGEPVTTSRLLIEGASVNGTGVTFMPEGVEPLGTHVPLPAGPATAQLNEALAAAGLAVEVLRGAPVTGGVQSDLLQVTVAYPSAGPGVPAGTVVFRFGGTTTSVVAGTGTLTPLVPSPPGPGTLPPPGAPAAGADAGSSAVPPTAATPGGPGDTNGSAASPPGDPATSGVDLPSGTNSTVEALTGDTSGDGSMTTPGLPGGEPLAAGPLQAEAASSWERFGASRLPYLALMAGAALLLAGTRLVGGKDKEAWWTS